MKLVDVLDSKSCVVCATCRFDSGHRHHLKDSRKGVFLCPESNPVSGSTSRKIFSLGLLAFTRIRITFRIFILKILHFINLAHMAVRSLCSILQNKVARIYKSDKIICQHSNALTCLPGSGLAECPSAIL